MPDNWHSSWHAMCDNELKRHRTENARVMLLTESDWFGMLCATVNSSGVRQSKLDLACCVRQSIPVASDDRNSIWHAACDSESQWRQTTETLLGMLRATLNPSHITQLKSCTCHAAYFTEPDWRQTSETRLGMLLTSKSCPSRKKVMSSPLPLTLTRPRLMKR